MRVCRLYVLHSELECSAGLSRYERGLLCGLCPALIWYRLYCFAVRIPLLPLRLKTTVSRLFLFVWVTRCRADDYGRLFLFMPFPTIVADSYGPLLGITLYYTPKQMIMGHPLRIAHQSCGDVNRSSATTF
jgi:hypothetical protein